MNVVNSAVASVSSRDCCVCSMRPKLSKIDINCSFLNSVPLSCKINLLHEVLDRISFMHAMETPSAVLVFSGTVIK